MTRDRNDWRLRLCGCVDAAVVEASLEALLGSYGVEIAHFSRPPGGEEADSHLLEARLQAGDARPSDRAELLWRRPLFEWARDFELDLLLLPADEPWEPPLVCAFDGDGTLFDGETIDEIAALAGKGEAVAAITAAAMRGELDFEAALRERVRQLRGLAVDRLPEIDAHLPVNAGAREFLATMLERGAHLALFTGGFHFFADARAAELGIASCVANRLARQDGLLSGELDGDIVDASAKAAALRALCEERKIPLQRSMASGDGANDLPMLNVAGLAVGFRPKDILLDRLDGALFRGDWTAQLVLFPTRAA